jgi:hypothetical protein
MLGDLLSRGLDQLVERGEMRIQEVVDRILMIDEFTSGSDMLGDLLSCGLEQLVERGGMRIQDVVDRILIIDLIHFRALICW